MQLGTYQYETLFNHNQLIVHLCESFIVPCRIALFSLSQESPNSPQWSVLNKCCWSVRPVYTRCVLICSQWFRMFQEATGVLGKKSHVLLVYCAATG